MWVRCLQKGPVFQRSSTCGCVQAQVVCGFRCRVCTCTGIGNIYTVIIYTAVVRVCPARVLDTCMYIVRTVPCRPAVSLPARTQLLSRDFVLCTRTVRCTVYLYDVPRASGLSTTGSSYYVTVYMHLCRYYYTCVLSLFAMPLWGLILTSSTGAQVDARMCLLFYLMVLLSFDQLKCTCSAYQIPWPHVWATAAAAPS